MLKPPKLRKRRSYKADLNGLCERDVERVLRAQTKSQNAAADSLRKLKSGQCTERPYPCDNCLRRKMPCADNGNQACQGCHRSHLPCLTSERDHNALAEDALDDMAAAAGGELQLSGVHYHTPASITISPPSPSTAFGTRETTPSAFAFPTNPGFAAQAGHSIATPVWDRGQPLLRHASAPPPPLDDRAYHPSGEPGLSGEPGPSTLAPQSSRLEASSIWPTQEALHVQTRFPQYGTHLTPAGRSFQPNSDTVRSQSAHSSGGWGFPAQRPTSWPASDHLASTVMAPVPAHGHMPAWTPGTFDFSAQPAAADLRGYAQAWAQGAFDSSARPVQTGFHGNAQAWATNAIDSYSFRAPPAFTAPRPQLPPENYAVGYPTQNAIGPFASTPSRFPLGPYAAPTGAYALAPTEAVTNQAPAQVPQQYYIPAPVEHQEPAVWNEVNPQWQQPAASAGQLAFPTSAIPMDWTHAAPPWNAADTAEHPPPTAHSEPVPLPDDQLYTQYLAF